MNSGLGIMLGLVLIVLGYAITLAHLKSDRQEWRVVWLIGRVIRMGSALRAAGIPFDDEEPLPETDFPEPPSWYGRWRRRRARKTAARAAKDAAELLPPAPAEPARTDTNPAGEVAERWAHAEETWGRDVTAVMPAPDAADLALARFRERMSDPRFHGHKAEAPSSDGGDGGGDE